MTKNNQSAVKIHSTYIYEANRRALFEKKFRIACNQGGTRSGKTYNIIILLISVCMNPARFGFTDLSGAMSVSVVSQTLPHLRKGAIRDFLRIMKEYSLYDENSYNRTSQVYTFPNGNYIEFFSADDDKKVRGPGRKILFINEANTVSKDIFIQLNLRTENKIIIDYNPADLYCWIYDDIIPRKDCMFIKSSYLDNIDFLGKEQVEEIEMLKSQDENYWKIYGLGERGTSENIIYNNWSVVSTLPQKIDETIYGLDFGFNNPTALVKISLCDKEPYLQELLYHTKLTNSQLIDKLKELEISPTDFIYCDNTEPNRIEEICYGGFAAIPADKSVKDGIDYVKRLKLKILEDSQNIIKEIKSYRWKQSSNSVRSENILDEPVKFNDHILDAARYALYTHSKQAELRIWKM